MPDSEETVTIKVAESITGIAAEDWDKCAGPDNPFVSHAFLSALEDSGSVCAETGWQPQHVLVEDDAGTLQAAAPCYLKNHSYGEYVFDWGWAEAFERAGGKYYPKLQVAVPFTPVTGPRLLIRPDADVPRMQAVMTAGLQELARQRDVSSLHITFCTREERKHLVGDGFLGRVGKQFHWHNRGYADFDDFLGALTSRKRKSIRKERRTANELVDIEVLTGDDLREDHMDAFYSFYLNTVDRKWAHAYLEREFFTLLRERLSDKIVMVFASDDGRPVGAALNLRGSDTLYGRNWGCSDRYRMLYFEACFYRAIEFAIDNNMAKVEAGAQGPHKISRGYLPSETFSAHWIRHEGFRDAVENFLGHEERQTHSEMLMLEDEMSPYRKDLDI